MELRATERRALDRLVKLERNWRWFRFVGAAVGLAIIAVGLWLTRETQQNLLGMTRQMSFQESPSGMEVYFASIFGGQLAIVQLLPVFGGLLLGMTLGRWRGNPVHQLLIGLATRNDLPEGHAE